MKKVLLSLILLFSGCANLYKTYIIDSRGVPLNDKSYKIEELKINNSGSMMLDSDILSNSIDSVMKLVLSRKGYTESAAPVFGIKLTVSIEENDIMNNTQAISLFLNVNEKGTELARFIFFTRTKEFLINKEWFIGEMEWVIGTLEGNPRRQQGQ